MSPVWASVWQQVKQQIRCMKNSSFLVDWTGEIRSYPVAQTISKLGKMNVDVWMFSTVLWVMMSYEEAAFFLHLVSSAVAPVFLMTLHRMNTRGSAEQQQLYWYRSFSMGVMAWCSAGRNSESLQQYHRQVYSKACVCWQMSSNKLSFNTLATVSYMKTQKETH